MRRDGGKGQRKVCFPGSSPLASTAQEHQSILLSLGQTSCGCLWACSVGLGTNSLDATASAYDQFCASLRGQFTCALRSTLQRRPRTTKICIFCMTDIFRLDQDLVILVHRHISGSYGVMPLAAVVRKFRITEFSWRKRPLSQASYGSKFTGQVTSAGCCGLEGVWAGEPASARVGGGVRL